MNIIKTASTPEVRRMLGKHIDWSKLKKWCVDNGITCTKETFKNLEVNQYPSIAWKAVYGLDLDKVFKL